MIGKDPVEPAGGKERRDRDVTAHMNKALPAEKTQVAQNLNELVKLLGVSFDDFIKDSAISRQRLATQIGKIDKSVIPDEKRDSIAKRISTGTPEEVAQAFHELDIALGENLGDRGQDIVGIEGAKKFFSAMLAKRKGEV